MPPGARSGATPLRALPSSSANGASRKLLQGLRVGCVGIDRHEPVLLSIRPDLSAASAPAIGARPHIPVQQFLCHPQPARQRGPPAGNFFPPAHPREHSAHLYGWEMRRLSRRQSACRITRLLRAFLERQRAAGAGDHVGDGAAVAVEQVEVGA